MDSKSETGGEEDLGMAEESSHGAVREVLLFIPGNEVAVVKSKPDRKRCK